MENITIETINATQRCTSDFALPMTGFWATDFAATDVFGVTSVVRDRSAATKGHLALVASIPGFHAWSPPIC